MTTPRKSSKSKLTQGTLFTYVPPQPTHQAIDEATNTYQANANTLNPDIIRKVFFEAVDKLPKNITHRKLNNRHTNGLKIALAGLVTPLAPDLYAVRGLYTDRKAPPYTVNLKAKTCTCADSEKGNTCEHRWAAYTIKKALEAQPINPITTTPSIDELETTALEKWTTALDKIRELHTGEINDLEQIDSAVSDIAMQMNGAVRSMNNWLEAVKTSSLFKLEENAS